MARASDTLTERYITWLCLRIAVIRRAVLLSARHHTHFSYLTLFEPFVFRLFSWSATSSYTRLSSRPCSASRCAPLSLSWPAQVLCRLGPNFSISRSCTKTSTLLSVPGLTLLTCTLSSAAMPSPTSCPPPRSCSKAVTVARIPMTSQCIVRHMIDSDALLNLWFG